MQFSSTHSISVPHLLQNQGPLILLVHPFQKISQPPGQDLQNGNQIYCQLPPNSFRINLKEYLLSHFNRPLRVLPLSKNLFEFFLKVSVYPTMIGKSYKSYGVQITGKLFAGLKN